MNNSIQTALKFIKSGNTIKMDILKILIDYVTQEELEIAALENPDIDIN